MDKMQSEEYLKDDLRVFVVPVDIFDVPGLTCHEQMVYMVLRSHCSAREMTAFPSYATIAREGRMSRDKAIQAMKKLIELGLVSKTEQYTVNKHRNIIQTANTYTIHTPKGSRSQRPGGSPKTTGVVVHNDRGSRSQRPKQNQLTDPYEQNQLTTTKKRQDNHKTTVVVDESTHEIIGMVESHLGESVKSLLPMFKTWIEKYGKDFIIERAKYAAQMATRNRVGAFRASIEDEWNISMSQVSETPAKDERYEAFYQLFPDD